MDIQYVISMMCGEAKSIGLSISVGERLLFCRGFDVSLDALGVDEETREYIFNGIMGNIILDGAVIGGYKFDRDGDFRPVIMGPYMGFDDDKGKEDWEYLREVYNERFRQE